MPDEMPRRLAMQRGEKERPREVFLKEQNRDGRSREVAGEGNAAHLRIIGNACNGWQ